jgi:hypothetical protein
MSLSSRLTLVVLGLVMLTAAAVGVLVYRNLAAAILPSELARVRAHVQRQAADLTEVMRLARNDASAFASGAAAIEGIVRARLNDGRDPQDGTTEEVWLDRMAKRFAIELENKGDYDQFRLIGIANEPPGQRRLIIPFSNIRYQRPCCVFGRDSAV